MGRGGAGLTAKAVDGREEARGGAFQMVERGPLSTEGWAVSPLPVPLASGLFSLGSRQVEAGSQD